MKKEVAINIEDSKVAKPFLKWAGGKTQLIPEMEKRLPQEFKDGTITRYIEPFVGSGAFLFYILENYKSIEEAIIFDINPELITVYQTVQNNVHDLIGILEEKENEFLGLDKEERKLYYYKERDLFNQELSDFNFKDYGLHKIKRSSQFIFLNKTCFNGLFRVNKSGFFNVPMGDYKNPTICNKENLIAASKVLEKVKIIEGDYKQSFPYVNNKTFVYFDPPYRPLNVSSSFTSYSKYDFKDEHQIELANYFKELHTIDAKLMLSNSDPKNTNPEDNFFEDIYELEEFRIERVSARRNINSKGKSRGQITELLITNY